MSHPVMKYTVIARFGALCVTQEWLWPSHPRLVLMALTTRSMEIDLKQSEVGISSVGLQGVPRRTKLGVLLITILPPILSLFRRSRRTLHLLPCTLLLMRSARQGLRRLFQLYVLLGSEIEFLSCW